MKKIIEEVKLQSGQLVKRITCDDERFYIQDGRDTITGLPVNVYVPSVTWICGHYPKGIAFYKWLADKGWNEAEAIKSAAGDKGSKVHYAITTLLTGKEITMEDKFLNPTTEQPEELTLEEYECVLSFADWFQKENPKEIIANEYAVFGDGYAGTIDIKYRKQDDRIGILDIKSGQYIWPEYELQLSAYKHAETDKIDFMEILQVGYHRNKNKYKLTEIKDKFDLFLAAKKIWANECAGLSPKVIELPLKIKLPIEPKNAPPAQAEAQNLQTPIEAVKASPQPTGSPISPSDGAVGVVKKFNKSKK